MTASDGVELARRHAEADRRARLVPAGDRAELDELVDLYGWPMPADRLDVFEAVLDRLLDPGTLRLVDALGADVAIPVDSIADAHAIHRARTIPATAGEPVLAPADGRIELPEIDPGFEPVRGEDPDPFGDRGRELVDRTRALAERATRKDRHR